MVASKGASNHSRAKWGLVHFSARDRAARKDIDRKMDLSPSTVPRPAPRELLCLNMAFLGQLPPNLVFVIGILKPVKWTVAAARPWRRPADAPADASPARSASKAPATPEDPSDASDNPD